MTLKLAVIGGSGLYDLESIENKKTILAKEGPFGMPSGNILTNYLGVKIHQRLIT